jgi:hypothetical protein
MSALAVLLGANSVWAVDTLSTHRAAPVIEGHRCAADGPGYFVVPGSDNCIKISGYVGAGAQFATGPGNAQTNELFGSAPATGVVSGIGVATDMKFQTPTGSCRVSIGIRCGQFQNLPADDQ